MTAILDQTDRILTQVRRHRRVTLRGKRRKIPQELEKKNWVTLSTMSGKQPRLDHLISVSSNRTIDHFPEAIFTHHVVD